MKTSPLHGEFDQLLLASSEGCGLHLRMIVTSNILVKKNNKNSPNKLTCEKNRSSPNHPKKIIKIVILLISLLVKKKKSQSSLPPDRGAAASVIRLGVNTADITAGILQGMGGIQVRSWAATSP